MAAFSIPNQLKPQFDAIGSYQLTAEATSVEVEWETPQGVPPTSLVYELRFVAEAEDQSALEPTLTRVFEHWLQVAPELPTLLPRVHDEVVKAFRDVYEDQLDEDELDDLRDDEGVITDAAIIADAEFACIELAADIFDGELTLETRFFHQVNWDIEHGITIVQRDGELAWEG